MLERDEKIIDFKTYKYAAPKILSVIVSVVVLLVTLVLEEFNIRINK